ncbi:MAG: pyruvate kinase [Planctomycetota bacterium]
MPITPPLILTKILATLGPSSREPAVIQRLIEEGVRVVRINFSHGSFDDYSGMLAAVREASAAAGVPVGVLGDLSGPKIRVSHDIEGGRIELAPGDHVEFTGRAVPCRRDPHSGVVTLSTTYPEMVGEVEPGDRVLVNDGAIRMLVTDVVRSDDSADDGRRPDDPRLICSVTVGGPVTPKKGVNLPDSEVSAPSLTDYDEQCARWAVEQGFDYLALSFVRRAADVDRLQTLLQELGRDGQSGGKAKLPVIAKIEKPQAIAELDGILRSADGVMVARGDLGVEMDLAEVPVLQKRIIERAHDYGRPVIVATQMLESMIESATPTRAEVSDIANAILDGADATMLSGETAVGKHATAVVQTMARTARKTEAFMNERSGRAPRPPKLAQESRYRTAALAHGVATICRDLEPRFIVMWSELGGGAGYMSQHRLQTPIIAVSSNHEALRQMALLFGVWPVYMDRPPDRATFLAEVDKLLLGDKLGDVGDAVVVVKGDPLGIPGVTNVIRIHYLGDVCRVTWRPKDAGAEA